MKYLILFILSSNVYSFFLITSNGAAFKKDEVKVFLTSNSSCSQANLTQSLIFDAIKEASDSFWNRVPTANIKVKLGGTFQTNDSKFLTEKLCAEDSNNSCPTATSVPKVNDIVIACNNNTTDNFPNASFLAITTPNNIDGKNIKGSVILINDSPNSAVSALSRNELISLIAHEIGHALGLGHSKDNAALMFAENSSNSERLADDDIRGITYLYPNKLDGCGGFLGSINNKTTHSNTKLPSNRNNFYFIKSLIFGVSTGILLILILKLIYIILSPYRHRNSIYIKDSHEV